MISCGNKIRLTTEERKQLAGLTGVDPGYLRNRYQLERFIERHTASYPGRTAEERLMRALLESFLPSGAA